MRGYTQLFQSCWTRCDLMNYRPPGSSVCGFLQARILEWFAMPSSGGSNLHFCTTGRFFTAEPLGKPLYEAYILFYYLDRSTELYLSSLEGCLGMIWTFLHSHPPHRNFPENKPLAHMLDKKMLARVHIIIKKTNVSMLEYWPSHALPVSLHICLPFLLQELRSTQHCPSQDFTIAYSQRNDSSR